MALTNQTAINTRPLSNHNAKGNERKKKNTEKRLVTIVTCLQLYHTVCQRTGLEWTQEKRMARLILYQKMTKIQEKIKLKWEAHLSSIKCQFCKLENLPLWIKLANNVTNPTQEIKLHINSLIVILQSCILSLPHSTKFHSKKNHGSFQVFYYNFRKNWN